MSKWTLIIIKDTRQNVKIKNKTYLSCSEMDQDPKKQKNELK